MNHPTPHHRLLGHGLADVLILRPRFFIRSAHRVLNANPSSEHALYLQVIITSSGGW